MRLFLFFCILIPLHSIAEPFPSKPLKIIVYTKPGGLVDITARKLGTMLEEELKSVGNSQPVVVENKKGAGGLVAINHLTRQPADGHTLIALTSSVISKSVQSKKTKALDDLQYLARIVDDYECLIVRDDSYADLNALIEDAKKRQGSQVWVGPAAGGTDHLFAKKFWKAADVTGTWVPYKSGGEAIAALLGKHGDVYVGNPQDTLGRKNLKIIAVASPERLAQFTAAPTFKELGLDALTGESLWRGIAVAKKTTLRVAQKLTSLLQAATKREDWLTFVKEGAAQPIFEGEQKFAQVVATQIEDESRL